MGNCCERMFIVQDIKMPLEIDPIEAATRRNIANVIARITPDLGLVNTHFQQSADPNELHLRRQFDETEVSKMTDQFLDEMALYRPQVQLFRTLDKDLITGQFMGMNLPKPDSSELISVFIQDYQLPFSAEFFLYCSLNQEVKAGESFAEDEIVHVESYNNTIYILNRLKTEKLLLVAPRNILMLRVIKRIDQDRYLDMHQTVDVTPLATHPRIKNMVETLKENFATTFISGLFIENREGGCRCSSFARSDFRTSVKMTFLKIFLNKNFENTMTNIGKNMRQMWEKESWRGKKGIWFESGDGRRAELGWEKDRLVAVLDERLRRQLGGENCLKRPEEDADQTTEVVAG